MELDDVLKELGDFGRYQTIVYLLISLIGQVPGSWHMLAISFLGAVPDHRCQVPAGGTLEGSIPTTVDPDTGEVVYDSCRVYTEEGVPNTTTKCEEWEYSEEPYGDTIVSEWDLVCDDAKFVEISQVVFMTGVMIGSVLFGQLSDRFGRKPILFVSLALQLVAGTTVALSTGIVFFTSVRFFVGVLEQGYDITSYVMVTELFTPHRRAYAGILLTNFWALGIMSLPLLAWLIQDWRYLQLAITLPLALTLPLWWFIPESPRWLISVGRYKKANGVLSKIAVFNGKDGDSIQLTPDDDSGLTKTHTHTCVDTTEYAYEEKEGEEFECPSDVEDRKTREPSDAKNGTTGNPSDDKDSMTPMDPNVAGDVGGVAATILDLFQTPILAKITIVMMFVWIVNAIIYYGLSLNTGSLAGDPYLNFFLSGAVEIPSYIMAVFVVTWFGRKIPVFVFHIIGGLACAVTVFIPSISGDGKDLTPLIITTAMTGKFCIAATYAIIFLYASEVFPTVVRNVGIGVLSFSSRIGGIIAPLMILLEDRYPKLPMITFGILSILAGFAILLLPETKGKKQPQTIGELEALHGR